MIDNTLRMGLLGYPVAHSQSPRLFAQLGKTHGVITHYSLFERAEVTDMRTELQRLFTDHSLDGLNVTAPYKERVAEVMTTLSPRAASVRAVNLVTRSGDGFHGDNTDLVGCRVMLTDTGSLISVRAQPDAPNQDVLPMVVLGAGGAARVILQTLREMGCPAYVHNRTEDTGRHVATEYGATYLSADELATIRISFSLFSALPASAPLPVLPRANLRACYDVAYIDSPLKCLADECRLPYYDGYMWLAAQARENFALLTGRKG